MLSSPMSFGVARYLLPVPVIEMCLAMLRNWHVQACDLIPPEGHIPNSTNNSPPEVLFPCGDYSRSSRQPGHMQVTLLQTVS